MKLEAISPWLGPLKTAWQIISNVPPDKRGRTKDREEALTSLSDAYHATEGYYAFLRSNPRDEERELEIARKWYSLSILLKKYDATLAQRMDLKSRYWREGASWSKKEVIEAGIGLKKAWTEINAHLRSDTKGK